MDGPYRVATTALATTPERQLAAPLRRKLFFRQRGLGLLCVGAAMQALTFLQNVGSGRLVPLCLSGLCVVFAAYSAVESGRSHRRRMRLLETGKVVTGRVTGRVRRARWRGGHILGVELADGHLVEVFSPRDHLPGAPVRIAYETGRSEHAFVVEDLPEPLRLDGDTWTEAELLPVPPPAIPPPSPRS